MAHSLEQALTGISGILVTPFGSDGELAPQRLVPIVDRALEAGLHMPVVNGNIGEFYSLTTDEACTMVREVSGIVNGRAPLLAGVGRSVRDACRLAKVSADAGAAALMIHQPPDPFAAPRGIVDYLKAVADAAGLPMMLYLRNDAIGTAAIAELCAVEGVKGVKWATPNPLKLGKPRPLAIQPLCGSVDWRKFGARPSTQLVRGASPPASSMSGRNAHSRSTQHSKRGVILRPTV